MRRLHNAEVLSLWSCLRCSIFDQSRFSIVMTQTDVNLTFLMKNHGLGLTFAVCSLKNNSLGLTGIDGKAN